jgi:hypothetical protein
VVAVLARFELLMDASVDLSEGLFAAVSAGVDLDTVECWRGAVEIAQDAAARIAADLPLAVGVTACVYTFECLGS